MRNAIAAQCFGALSNLCLSNGILLLYLKALEVKSAHIMLALSLPFVIDSLPRIFLAYYADRYGKKRFGMIGVGFTTLGFAVLILAAFLPWRLLMITLGLVLYGVGVSFFTATWFALLSPVVPETMRGRFFGRLRVSWQTVGIVFAGICALFLSQDSSLGVFVIVLLVVTVALAIRGIFYVRIPEMESVSGRKVPLIATVKQLLATNNLMAFGCYIFLLMLAIAAIPSLFGLIEKDAMNLSDRNVVIFANIAMVGNVAGFWIGGRAVDRWGTKSVFMACHGGVALIVLGFLLRHAFDPILLLWLGLMHFGFGLTFAASSIAISSETLELIPEEHKSLSTSTIQTLHRLGVAFSGILSGWALDLGFLAEEWQFFGLPMSPYDAILLVSAIFVMLLIVTLGLIPSVMGSHEWPNRSL